jgi:hypothetical protein
VLIGGGNSTIMLSVLMKRNGNEVHILTRKPEKWTKSLSFDNEDLKWLPESEYSEEIDSISDDYSVIIGADMVFIAGMPIHHNREILTKIKDYLPDKESDKKVFLGTVCAYGGFNWLVDDILREKNVSPFGTQLIPWCCGTKEYGKKGVVFGAKRLLRIATLFGKDEDGVKEVLSPILCQTLEDTSFLSSLFWPNNAWLHPPILYGLFKDWDGESYFPESELPKLIYAELTKASGDTATELDAEICGLLKTLSKHFKEDKFINMNYSLQHNIILNYTDDVSDQSTVTSCISTCKAFGKHKIPYETNEENEIRPVLDHKFFLTDLPYGLVPMKNIAQMCSYKTPVIDKIIEWNQKLIKKEYLVDGKLEGKNLIECVYPNMFEMGLDDVNG